MNLWDGWAISYRNARALGALAVFVLAIVLMQSLRCNPMVAREEVVGRVIEVEARDLRPMGGAEPNCRVVVALPDSSQIRLFVPPPVPRLGDLIPLHAERFERGDTHYFLAGDRWRTEGPLPGDPSPEP